MESKNITESEKGLAQPKAPLAEAPAELAASSSGDNDEEKGSTKSNTDVNTDELTLPPAEPSDVVDWDGADDPKNPLNWSPLKKWSTIYLVSYITFVT